MKYFIPKREETWIISVLGGAILALGVVAMQAPLDAGRGMFLTFAGFLLLLTSLYMENEEYEAFVRKLRRPKAKAKKRKRR